jgi:hypothetical protein
MLKKRIEVCLVTLAQVNGLTQTLKNELLFPTQLLNNYLTTQLIKNLPGKSKHNDNCFRSSKLTSPTPCAGWALETRSKKY